jgi:hypothetical protein
MGSLNNSDYRKILEFYNLPIPSNKKILKKKAEDILALKLCRCIKKFEFVEEAKAIGICTRSVLNKKGLKRSRQFTCRKKQKLSLTKTMKQKK